MPRPVVFGPLPAMEKELANASAMFNEMALMNDTLAVMVARTRPARQETQTVASSPEALPTVANSDAVELAVKSAPHSETSSTESKAKAESLASSGVSSPVPDEFARRCWAHFLWIMEVRLVGCPLSMCELGSTFACVAFVRKRR